MRNFSIVLLVASITSTPVFATDKAECLMEKHMAGYALTMIKGGATLNQTIQVLADTGPKKQIIEKIFTRRDSLDTADAAGEMGKRMCRQLSASL
jgi:hypothetical protein